MDDWAPLTDGVVTLRPPTDADRPVLVAGRDAESRRFLGDGDPDPRPWACITVAGTVVGWVDFDHDRDWLEADEVNVGYAVFPDHRGRGCATRAVRLLLQHLAAETTWRVATFLIHRDNERSLALARRVGATLVDDLEGSRYWKLPLAGGSPVRVLTDEELARFDRDGVVLLRAAFPREVAERCCAHLWSQLRQDPDDP